MWFSLLVTQPWSWCSTMALCEGTKKNENKCGKKGAVPIANLSLNTWLGREHVETCISDLVHEQGQFWRLLIHWYLPGGKAFAWGTASCVVENLIQGKLRHLRLHMLLNIIAPIHCPHPTRNLSSVASCMLVAIYFHMRSARWKVLNRFAHTNYG